MAESVAEGPGPTDVVGVALAAGEGRRLRPLSGLRPKPLCPVGNVAPLDAALDRLAAVADTVVVNVHHGRAAMETHLAGRVVGWIEADGSVTADPDRRRDGPGPAAGVHVSLEAARALGTAGAIGRLRPFLDGRPALVVNADTWCPAPLADLVAGWDGERIRLLLHGDAAVGPRMRVVASLLPATEVARLPAEPAGLWERCWSAAAAGGRLESLAWQGPFADCGTPASYLAANLAALGPRGGAGLVSPTARVQGSITGSVVGAGADVAGSVVEAVVWDGAEVVAGERLVRAVRADRGVTVLVR